MVKNVFLVDGVKTLPLPILRGNLAEKLDAFQRTVKVHTKYVDPSYKPIHYDSGRIVAIAENPQLAIEVVVEWYSQFGNYAYFVEIKDDPSRDLIHALHDHTRLVSDIGDARLQMDTQVLWAAYDDLQRFESAHADYRADPDREANYDEHASRAREAFVRLQPHFGASKRLIDRIARQIELKSSVWKRLSPLHKPAAVDPSEPVRVFYSYSHKDEELRTELEKHLSIMRRSGLITGWHDRRISVGREWEGQIDEHLQAAHLILLLVSPDFLSSDYCYDIEMKCAMERHEAESARVVPVILRPCQWKQTPFAKLLALPKDGKPITSSLNVDEAFTNVAAGIEVAVGEMRPDHNPG